MSHFRTRVFICRPYTIDFKKKEVKIEGYKSRISEVYDFLINVIEFSFILGLITAFIFTLYNALFSRTISVNLIKIIFIWMIPVTLFSLSYKFLPYKSLTKIQMWLEESKMIIRRWKSIEFKLENSAQLQINLGYYFKYRLYLFGGCKEYVSKIQYKSPKNVPFKWSVNFPLIITFSKPTTGRVLFEYR